MFKIISWALVTGATFALAGCSGAGAAAARGAAQEFVNDLSGPPDAACGLLAPRALDALGAGRCTGQVISALPRDPVDTVEVWGDEAQARTRGDTLFLHEFSTGWRITGAGCHPRNEQVYDCMVGGR